MADPVAWKVIEPGWTVLDSAGEKVGSIDRVLGDPEADIFDGLAVGGGLLSAPTYVPSEQVGDIEEGTVNLAIDGDAFSQLEPYEE